MSQIDVASNSALLSVAEKLDTQNILLTAIASKDGSLPIKDWAGVQSIVRTGLAPKVFAIGDQLVCNHETYGELVWDIIGFDNEELSDGTKTHSMTIQLHSLLEDILTYDAPEALYYAQTELPAGTYNFTLMDGYDTAYGGGKTYYFTITKPVPAGGQIVFDWPASVQAVDCIISTYESQTGTTPVETVSVAEGNNGIALENTNHTQRARYGSNRWSQSAIRQWINSDKASGAWWKATNDYDRPVDYANTKNGFMKGLDKDFCSVIGEVTKRTALNTLSDGSGYEDTTERIFLVSRSEVYGGNENGVVEGTPYAYYSDFSDLNSQGTGDDTNRIRYRKGTPAYWWLRSCYSKSSTNVSLVSQKGSITSSSFHAQGVSPACCIY